jgi:hypothetical protein
MIMCIFAPANSLGAENPASSRSSSGLLRGSPLEPTPFTQADTMEFMPVSSAHGTTPGSPSWPMSPVSPADDTTLGSSGRSVSPGPHICLDRPVSCKGLCHRSKESQLDPPPCNAWSMIRRMYKTSNLLRIQVWCLTHMTLVFGIIFASSSKELMSLLHILLHVSLASFVATGYGK